MTVVIASETVILENGTEVQAQPAVFDAAWIEHVIAELGPQTVAGLVEKSGRSETTVRKMVKSMVDFGSLYKNTDSKPAIFELLITTEVAEDVVDEIAVAEALPIAPAPVDDDADAKIDEIMNAITAPPTAPTSTKSVKSGKSAKSKKVAHTVVPDSRNEFVQHQGLTMWATSAYALLENPPTFDSAGDGFAWANTARERSEGDHTPEEIAGLYLDIVTTYLEELYDNGDISHGVWYGRTFRLRRTLVGNVKGTAAARPATTTTDK
jgi:hypothetical protein